MLLQSRLKSLEKKIHTNNKKLKYEPGYWTWNPCLYEVLIKSKGAHFLIKYKKILAKSPGRHVIFQVLQVTSHDDSPGKRTLYKNLLLTYSPFSGIQSVGLQHQLPVGLIARLVGHWLGLFGSIVFKPEMFFRLWEGKLCVLRDLPAFADLENG